MNSTAHLLALDAKARATVQRMVTVRPGPRGKVIVRPACSEDEIEADADRTFEAGEQVLVASAQSAPSTYRVLGSTSTKSGAAPIAMPRRGRISTPLTEATFCPSGNPFNAWLLLSNGSGLSLWSYAGGEPQSMLWEVDPWPEPTPSLSEGTLIRQNGEAFILDRSVGGSENFLVLHVSPGGELTTWDLGVEVGIDTLTTPKWDGSAAVVALRTSTGSALYRWNGLADLTGLPPAWIPGPNVTEGAVEIALLSDGSIFATTSDAEYLRGPGGSWNEIDFVRAEGFLGGGSGELEVYDYQTVLSGEALYDIRQKRLYPWQGWSDGGESVSFLEAVPYRQGVLAIVGSEAWPSVRLLAVDLPQRGQIWSGSCTIPTTEISYPIGYDTVVGIGGK